MSLVGTRPPTVDEWDKYELHHRARLATKPGLAYEEKKLFIKKQKQYQLMIFGIN